MSDDCLFAQGQAKPATPEDIQKDEEGVTDPNLHRRIRSGNSSTEFTLCVQSVNSYRTKKKNIHKEGSTTSEVP